MKAPVTASTIVQAQDPQDTWHDLVRRVTRRKRLSGKACDALLWATTCFPFGNAQLVDKQLREAWDKGRKTVHGALAFADAEMRRALADSLKEGQHAEDPEQGKNAGASS